MRRSSSRIIALCSGIPGVPPGRLSRLPEGQKLRMYSFIKYTEHDHWNGQQPVPSQTRGRHPHLIDHRRPIPWIQHIDLKPQEGDYRPQTDQPLELPLRPTPVQCPRHHNPNRWQVLCLGHGHYQRHLATTLLLKLSQLAIRDNGQDSVQDWFQPNVCLHHQDHVCQPKDPPQCVYHLLREW